MLKTFIIIGYLEGISYLLLFFNMLVIKNIDIELYGNFLFPVGMAHGILFIAYVLLALILMVKLNWSMKKFALIFIASLIPFGTFYSERKWVYREIWGIGLWLKVWEHTVGYWPFLYSMILDLENNINSAPPVRRLLRVIWFAWKYFRRSVLLILPNWSIITFGGLPFSI